MIAAAMLLLAAENPFIKYGWMGGILEPGHRPCAEAWNAENRERSTAWTLGYISGLNEASKTIVGSQSDGMWLIDAVKVSCSAYPERQIYLVVNEIYRRHRHQR